VRPLLSGLPCVLVACAPLTGGPLPVPLAQDTTSTVELAVATPRAARVRDDPALPQDAPAVPHGQIQASSAFRLHRRVDAGPSFLLDLGARARPGPVTGGLFVRGWLTNPEREGQAALRGEAGWAWGGLGTDVSLPLTDESWFTVAPTVQITPTWLAARLPVGAVLRVERLDLGVEGGLTVGTGLQGGRGLAPWLAVRLRLSL